MRIPEETIEEIRTSASIVDFISGYVQLRKRGKNYIGLCPFHQEKTPSFTVSDEKQIFHCFGCHAGGNIFKFLMDYKSISFVESVQEVAEYLGITINYEQNEFASIQNEQEEYYDLNILAAKYYSNNLLKSEIGTEAREYLENRKIKTSTQKIFGLGFAPPGWDNFLNYAQSNKADLDKLKTLGLIDSKDGGKYYDKFRNRILFPIFSPNGRVIAFGGRVFHDEDNVAKYLNSPESIIYFKRKSLYGLYHSQDEIRKLNKAILVEGYMDLISLFQHGIKNVVASSGTSLTDDQVRLLSRYTKNIVVIFDADTAGRQASLRSIEILLKQDFDVNVLSLPTGEDPDSFVSNYGKEHFEEILNTAENFLEYQTSQYDSQGMFQNPATEAKAIRELVRSASFVNDELKRSLLIRSISRKFNLREKLLETELNKYLSQNKPRVEKEIIPLKKNGKPNSSKIENNEEIERLKPLEKQLVALLFEGNEEIVGHIFDNIMPEDFINPHLGSIAKTVYESYKSGNISPAAIIDRIENEKLRNFVLNLSLNEQFISPKWDDRAAGGKLEKDPFQVTVDTVKRYRLLKINAQIKQNINKIERIGEGSEILDLLKLNVELEKEKNLINAKEDSKEIE